MKIIGIILLFAALGGLATQLHARALDKKAVILEQYRQLRQVMFEGGIPAADKKTLDKADLMASGTIFFYDQPVKIGLSNIDWSGKNIAHQEWPAQLNRFYQLNALAAAYEATKDEKYAQAARSYIEDWIDHGGSYENEGDWRPGDRSLDLAERMKTWGETLPYFLKSPSFDDKFIDKVTDSADHQVKYLSTRIAAVGNWRIAGLDALVMTSLRYPFMKDAPSVLRIGIEGLRQELSNQFLSDGVHIERTPDYSAWMAQVAAKYLLLPKLFPEADAKVNPDIVAKSLDYVAQCYLASLNDSPFVPRDGAKLNELETRNAILKKCLPPDQALQNPPLDQVFPAAGQIFMRSAWKPGADYIAFDAGTWGGGHNHLGRLSFCFRSAGRMLLADPGIISYEMSNPMAPYGKSTPAHNTLNVDGWNQAPVDARLERADFNSACAFIHARYQGGYWSGTFGWNFDKGLGQGVKGDHSRILFWVKGEYIVALDKMETDAEHTVHNPWQMAPMAKWSSDPAGFSWWSQNEDVNLLVKLLKVPDGATMQVYEGSQKPLRGWVGGNEIDAVPAPQVDYSYPSLARGDVSAVLIAPFLKDKKPDYSLSPGTPEDRKYSGLYHLDIVLPDGQIDHYCWSGRLEQAVDDQPLYSTDASFIWLRTTAKGKPVKGYVLDASYLKVAGKTVFSRTQRKPEFFNLAKD